MSADKKVVGVCVANIQDQAVQRQTAAICRTAKQRGYKAIIYSVYKKLDVVDRFACGEENIFDSMRMEEHAAVIILSEAIQNERVVRNIISKAQKLGLPVVSINHKYEGAYNVLLDYDKPFEEIVRHVIEHHKCRRINFIAGYRGNEFSDARIDIFRKVMAENGLEVEEDRIGYGDFWEKPTQELCEKWLSSDVKLPDAIICANDVMAITACMVLRNHNIHVPEDVIVTGFDGINLADCCSPNLTTAQDDTEKIGKYAFDVIQACSSGEKINPYDVKVGFSVRFSESCGCKKKDYINLNEHIMSLDGKNAQMRIKTSDIFMMMTNLTSGDSVGDVVRRYENYRSLFNVNEFKIFAFGRFFSGTDIISRYEVNRDFRALLVETDGDDAVVPLRVLAAGEEEELVGDMIERNDALFMFPMHWQDEIYGFMAASMDIENSDYAQLYEFILALEQVLGTLRKQAKLRNMYVRDSLTMLYNRYGFYSALKHDLFKMKKVRKKIFLASIDMDGLKRINDGYGHGEGDAAISRFASILSGCVAKYERMTCARFGGDEFMVFEIMREEDEADEYEGRLRDELYERLDAYNEVSGKPYRLEASYGAVLRKISGYDQLDAFMREADDAMYRCKETHHGRRM